MTRVSDNILAQGQQFFTFAMLLIFVKGTCVGFFWIGYLGDDASSENQGFTIKQTFAFEGGFVTMELEGSGF